MTQIKFDNTFYDLERDIDSYMKAMHGTQGQMVYYFQAVDKFRHHQHRDRWRPN